MPNALPPRPPPLHDPVRGNVPHATRSPCGLVSVVQADAVVFDIDDSDATPEEQHAALRSATALADLCLPVIVPSALDNVLTVSNFDVVDLLAARALTTDAELASPDPAVETPPRFLFRYLTRATARRLAVTGADASSLHPAHIPPLGPSASTLGKRRAPAPSVTESAHAVAEPSRPAKRRKLSDHTSSSSDATQRPRPAPRRASKAGKKKPKPRTPKNQGDARGTFKYDVIVLDGNARPVLSTPSAAENDVVYAPVPFDLQHLTYDPDLALNSKRRRARPLPWDEKEPRLRVRPDEDERKARLHEKRHTTVVFPERPPPASSSPAADVLLPPSSTTALSLPTSSTAPAATAPLAPSPSPSDSPHGVALETLNRSLTGYGGHIPRKRVRDLLNVWGTPALQPLLDDMHVVPENGLDTAVCDRNMRCVVFRSKPVTERPGQDLMTRLCADVRRFTDHVNMPASAQTANSRGDHFAGCMGVHRQYTATAKETVFHRKYREEAEWLVRSGGPLSVYLKVLEGIMKRRFPNMYARMNACVDWHVKDAAARGVPFKPLFGPFMNCCVNAPAPHAGVERVTTRPHTDARNAGTFYCAFLSYWDDGWLGEHEWSYLVVWELGIILACPRGSWVIYPSALLLHFNIRVVKCKKGETPTPFNTEELNMQGKSRRGSIVVFTQATMISVTDEKERIPALASYESAVAHCFPRMTESESLIDGLE